MPPRTKGKSKKELLADKIAEAVRAGREVAVETVDFSDPNRPKTCLEVDFPIIPINQIAAIEGNAGKPIYQMSKWWARRRSSVFRSMLLAAAMKAPEDESLAAKAVWEVYYANHQKRGTLRHLTVADPFMGGGTTIVEGSRLGMQMFGCDLNPVAWFVVKNEMAQVDLGEVKRLLADIEADVKPLIMPYYACDGPDGEKGKWFRNVGTKEREKPLVQSDLLGVAHHDSPLTEVEWEELPPAFDIFSVPWQERYSYRYEGPEIIYTFWAKHGPCQREGCGHRTPIMSTPVIAVKTLTVDAWRESQCRECGKKFDVERHPARMAPDVPLFVAPDEKPFAVMDNEGRFACPHCGNVRQDRKAFAENNSPELGKAENKRVGLTLLMHPQWLEGCPKCDEQGREYGGSATDSVEATINWNNARAAKLRLLEVRGTLPEQVTCPETKVTFYTDVRGGTAPITKSKTGEMQARQSTFACGEDGTPNNVLTAIKATNKTGPVGASVIQGFSKRRDTSPYRGRFFKGADVGVARIFNEAMSEWESRKTGDLAGFWPVNSLFEYDYGNDSKLYIQPDHGFTHWWKMFNPRQLLLHSQLLRAIGGNSRASQATKDVLLGAFEQYLQAQSMYCSWNIQTDRLAVVFSNNNFHPKSVSIEGGFPWAPFGHSRWVACARKVFTAMEWANAPWELVPKEQLTASKLDAACSTGSEKVVCGDPLGRNAQLRCGSATDLVSCADRSVDCVVTDPPFGSLIHYSDLADFFLAWLRLPLSNVYSEEFAARNSPRQLEVISNSGLHKDAELHYQQLLTASWHESFRVLKDGGILAFTFHHSEDEPWVAVLESLFDAGFYLEATYPIRSDETKGDQQFGSKQIEYDIIHVCRKRMAKPQSISWARLRRQITDDVRRIRNLLSQHQKEGLPAADLQVIRRGKALEYFSRHYGEVFVEQGREFTIREALVGINQLLDDEAGTAGGPEAPPSNAEPYTRQFFRLFYETAEVPRDQMQKFLRGTGIAPSDFEQRGWCSEKNKVFTLTPPVELARNWKGASRKGMARDFDQTMFLVGGCVEGSGIRVTDTLDSPNFAPHPATDELVDWLARHGGTQDIKHAAQRARTIYRDWLSKNRAKAQEQMKLFDLET